MIPRLIAITTKLANNQLPLLCRHKRFKTYYRSGAVKAMPEQNLFGLVGVTAVVTVGLGIGAYISKHIASFLEENDLFIPEDDDDDD